MINGRQQAMLFNPGTLVEYRMDPGTFHAQLAVYGRALFRDEDFSALYKNSGLGRPCVPPSQMAILMLLQYEAGISDGEAVERSGCDLRWAAALDRMPGPPLCGRTTLILFRARLALHNAVELVFDQSLAHARKMGLLKAGKLKVLLDTRPVMGRGAVEDTFNLIARAMDRLMDQLAAIAGVAVVDWAAAHQLSRYVRRRDRSLKGQLEIDWSDPQARRQALTELVGDARRLAELSGTALRELGERDPKRQKILAAELDLLQQILAQDVEENQSSGGGADGKATAEIKEGTARDRMPSATDPDQRHGHKSASKKFTGHKLRIAADTESDLILDVDVLAGNAGDAEGALAQIEQVEERTDQEVELTIGDCAFAGGATRREFADQGRTLHARQPLPAASPFGISKSKFQILFDENQKVSAVVCPAGNQVTERTEAKDGSLTFRFGKLCGRCPMRHQCVSAKRISTGRTIQIHPEERLLQDAREFQKTVEGKRLLAGRVKVEHALARMARLGVGQARYIGRVKTRFQMLMAAAVVNLRLTWNRMEAEPQLSGPDSASESLNSGSGGQNGDNGGALGGVRRPQGDLRPDSVAILGSERPLGPKQGALEALRRLGPALRISRQGLCCEPLY